MKPLYENDVLAWSEEQAEALRELNRSEIAAEADWERLALGIERVGRWAQGHVETGIRTMLAQALAGYCDPDSLRRYERLSRSDDGKGAAQREMTATIRKRLDLDHLWREAFNLAVAELGADHRTRAVLGLVIDPDASGLRLPPGLPERCPFTLDELLADDFTYDRGVEELYMRLTSWRPKHEKDDTP